LAALGGGCDLPFAANARIEGGCLTLRGVVAALDGSKVIRAECSAPAGDPEGMAALEALGAFSWARLGGPSFDPESLGARLALDLENQGARTLLVPGEKVRPD